MKYFGWIVLGIVALAALVAGVVWGTKRYVEGSPTGPGAAKLPPADEKGSSAIGAKTPGSSSGKPLTSTGLGSLLVNGYTAVRSSADQITTMIQNARKSPLDSLKEASSGGIPA